MATLSIKDNQLFQIKAHMAMLGLKKYYEWIDYILHFVENYDIKQENKKSELDTFKGVLKDNGVKGRNNEEH